MALSDGQPVLSDGQSERLGAAWDAWKADPNNRALELAFCRLAEMVGLPYYRDDGTRGNWIGDAYGLRNPNAYEPVSAAVLDRPAEKEIEMATKSDLFPSKWLKADDLPKPRVLTVEAVREVEMNDPNGTGKTVKPVLYFTDEDRGLVLNATNFDAVTEITGEADTDDWAGARVELYATKVKFGSKTVMGVRIRAPRNGSQPEPAGLFADEEA